MKSTPPFLTVFPDGLEVSWKLLPIGDYLKLTSDPYLAFNEVEDIIFSKCVLDEYLVSKIDYIKAGIVPTVVSGILANSIPNNPEEFQVLLDYYRVQVDKTYLEELVLMVLLAFPAYRPEDVYSLDLPSFMHRVALAERKLLSSGLLQKPLQLSRSRAVERGPSVKPQEFKKQWEESQKPRKPPMEMPSDIPPIPEYTGEKTVIKRADTPPSELLAVGTESDVALAQEKMLRDTLPFYSDYLEILEKGDKITPDKIKTPAQKEKEAKARMEVSKKELAKQLAEHRRKESGENERLNGLFEKGLSKKQKKKISRNR